jgi:uncharacterized membrane protein YozB (DUF420 family)
MSKYERGSVRRWTAGRKTARAVQITLGLVITIVLLSFVKRLVLDVPHLAAGTVPADGFDRRYATHPWVAYLHITPGVLYLLLAILQLTYRFRSRHYLAHRRLGRIAAGAAILSGVFALIFGGLFAFGGPAEASASVVFSLWMLICVVIAVRAIRRGDIVRHRRWMIRAFAIGAGVGTVRIWLTLFQGFGLLDFQAALGPAFWIGFSLHALAAELWLRAFPKPPEAARSPEPESVLKTPSLHAPG